MTSTLLIVQIVLSIAITISVLLQKSSSIGLGAYSGSNESMFGAKGPMGFLAKVTFTLALLFVLNTLALGYFYTKENKSSVVDTVESVVPVSPEKSTTTPPAPAAPSLPTAKSAKSLPATPVAKEESKPAVEETKEATPKSAVTPESSTTTEAPSTSESKDVAPTATN